MPQWIVIEIQPDDDGETDADENQRTLGQVNELLNAGHGLVAGLRMFCVPSRAIRG